MTDNQKLLTIGQIARTLGITRRIIINYEQHGLITADTRGELNSGYRYYSMDTMVRIRTIRTYQKFGLSLNEIKEYLEGGDLSPVIQRLEILKAELDENLKGLKERFGTDYDKISISTLPQYTAYTKTIHDTSIESRVRHLRDVAYTAVARYGTDNSHRMYFTQHKIDDPDTVTYCAAVPFGSKGEDVQTFSEAKALIKYHRGSYEKLPFAKQELLNFAHERGIILQGFVRYVFLEGPPQHKDPEKFITMVALFICT